MLSGSFVVIILARLLSANSYGLLYLTLSFYGIVGVVSRLGVDKSAAKYISEYKNENSGQIPHIIKSSIIFIILLSTFVSGLIIVKHKYIANILEGPEIIPLLLLGIVFMFATSLFGFVRHTLQGFEDIQSAATSDAIRGIGKLVFATGLVLLGYNAVGALSGYIVSTFVATIFAATIIYKKHYRPIEYTDTIEPGLRRRIAGYAIPLTSSRAADKLDKQVDTVLVGIFLTPLAVGYYTVAKQVVSFIQVPVNALGFTIAPTFGSSKATGDLKQARAIYETSFINVLLLYLPAAAGLVLVAEPTIELVFGSDYSGAVPVLQILSIYAVLLALAKPTSHGLDFLGRAKIRAVVKGVTSVLNFLLNLLLIPMLGVVGAAIATVFTFSVYTAANIYVMSIELNLRTAYLLKNAIIILGITSVMSGCVFILRDHITGWLTLSLVILGGMLIWIVLSIGAGVLDPKEIYRNLLH